MNSEQNKLSIQLLPEFGWSMLDNEPVYGPGSVIQGKVHLSDPLLFLHADRLRLIFHGSERTRHIPIYKNQFFGTQSTLWDNKQPTTASSFDFTLQLPLVQFPPSMDHALYNCYFKLSAFLEGPQETLTTASKEVILRPFLETRLLKTPIVHQLGPTKVSLQALDYVPGDSIQIHLSSTHIVHMALDQTVTCRWQEATQKTRIVATMTGDHTLALPSDLIPSFSFSPVIAVSYHLTMKLKTSGRFGASHELTLPIQIGTLGYGLRASSDLQIYSVFPSAFDPGQIDSPTLPLPVFMKSVVYEDALPRYEADRLPAYT